MKKAETEQKAEIYKEPNKLRDCVRWVFEEETQLLGEIALGLDRLFDCGYHTVQLAERKRDYD